MVDVWVGESKGEAASVMAEEKGHCGCKGRGNNTPWW